MQLSVPFQKQFSPYILPNFLCGNPKTSVRWALVRNNRIDQKNATWMRLFFKITPLQVWGVKKELQRKYLGLFVVRTTCTNNSFNKTSKTTLQKLEIYGSYNVGMNWPQSPSLSLSAWLRHRPVGSAVARPRISPRLAPGSGPWRCGWPPVSAHAESSNSECSTHTAESRGGTYYSRF